MKTSLLTLLVVAISLASAKADLLLYEGFDYTAGTSLNGKVLDGTWTWETYNDGGGNIITNAGLSFADVGYAPDYQVSGLATIADGTNTWNGGSWGNYSFSSLNLPTPPSRPATLYYSFLAKNTSTDNSAWASEWMLQGADRPGGTGGFFITGVYGGGPVDWTLEAFSVPSDSTGFAIPSNTTFFTVVKVTWDASLNVTASAVVNPSFAAEPDTWDAEVEFQHTEFGKLLFLLAPQGNRSMVFDELRVATTYQDALPSTVPEPGTCVLIGLGAGALLLRRKAGRR